MSAFEIGKKSFISEFFCGCNGVFDKHQLLMVDNIDKAFCESYTCVEVGFE